MVLWIVFDIDGVLVNVDRSYFQAIYDSIFAHFPNDITRTDILTIKNTVGFNNDWDAAYALYVYYWARSQSTMIPKSLSDFLVQFSTPSVQKIIEFVEKRLPMLLLTYAELKDEFQARYLGQQIFRSLYDRKPPLVIESGLWETETLIFDSTILSQLAASAKLAIITGRTPEEAAMVLAHFGIASFFEHIISVEDPVFAAAVQQSLVGSSLGRDKSNPLWIKILADKEKIASTMPIVYIGDTVNDIQLVNHAKSDFMIRSIGFVHNANQKKMDLLRVQGADNVAGTVADVVCLLTNQFSKV